MFGDAYGGMQPGAMALTQTSVMQQGGPSQDHKDLLQFNHQLMGMYSDLMGKHVDLIGKHKQLVSASSADVHRHVQNSATGTKGPGKVTSKQGAVCLGVIRLDYDYPPAPGDIDSPESFGYDVFYRVVPGLTFGMCQSGKMTAAVEQNFEDALDWLVAKGVTGITGDCGFMMYFQQLARRKCSKPVFMSALAQTPAVTCAFNCHELIAIFTANSETLKPMRNLIKDECGVDPEERRFVIVGCQNVPGFEAVAEGGKVNVQKVTPGMVELAQKTLKEHPKIRAILFECTELPPYSDAVRAATRLPVFDAITCCDFFISGAKDNVRFGINNWQADWDGQQANYKFGANLNKEEIGGLVNKIKD